MRKQIPAALHLRLAAKGGTFAKPDESQGQAIKRLMAQRKRELSAPSPSASNFPRFVPGLTTTWDYVMVFFGGQPPLHLDIARLGYRLAPYHSEAPQEVSDELQELG